MLCNSQSTGVPLILEEVFPLHEDVFQFHSGVAAGSASISSTASMSPYCTSVQHCSKCP